MRPITPNYISQTQHGQFNAIDYSAYKDRAKTIFNPWIHAPTDGKITLVQREVLDDCGRKLWHQGAVGRTGVCHIEEFYVKQGQDVKAGQLLAKMGFTGKTVPTGEAGRHAHQVLQLSSGEYVYPPSRITESFKGDDMEKPINEGDLVNISAELDVPEPQAKRNNWHDVFYQVVVPRIRLFRKEKPINEGDLVNVANLFGLKKAKQKNWHDVFYKVIVPEVEKLKKSSGATKKQLAAEKAIESIKEALK